MGGLQFFCTSVEQPEATTMEWSLSLISKSKSPTRISHVRK